MENNYGLLIASIVAIVAIVGLVVLFNGSNTGAKTLEICPEGYRVAQSAGVGQQGAYFCIQNEPVWGKGTFPTWEEHKERRQEILLSGFPK